MKKSTIISIGSVVIVIAGIGIYSLFGGDNEIQVVSGSEEVALRARGKKVIGDTLKVFAKGASYDHPSSFLRQKPLLEATNYGLDLYETAVPLFKTFWDGQPIRQVGITLTNLSSAAEKQLSLFDQGWEQKERIGAAMDSIHSRYGPASLVRASSLTRAGQVFERANKIGGHYK